MNSIDNRIPLGYSVATKDSSRLVENPMTEQSNSRTRPVQACPDSSTLLEAGFFYWLNAGSHTGRGRLHGATGLERVAELEGEMVDVPTEGARRESIDLMASIAESLKALPQLVEALKGNLCVEKQEPAPLALSKEAQAIGLLFTLDGASKTEIAKAIGLADNTSLRHMERFKFACWCLDVAKSFEPGDYRTTGRRRNGRELYADDGTEG